MTKPIVVPAKFGQQDYLNYCRFRSYYLSKAGRNIYCFPVLLLIFVVVNFLLGNDALGWILLSFAAFIPLWMELNLRAYAKKDAERFGLAQEKVRYTVTFQGDEIGVKNETEETTFSLKKIWKICRTKRTVYLFITPEHGFILPLSSFEEGEAKRLFALCERKLTKEQMVVKLPWYEKSED